MNLGAQVDAVLPGLRVQAESLMTDRFRIVRADGEPVWDEATGDYTATESVVYEGIGRIRFPGVGGRRVDEQGDAVTVQDAVLSLPIAGTGGVRVDDVAECVASRHDPQMVGVRFRIDEPHWQSHSTARRFGVEVES